MNILTSAAPGADPVAAALAAERLGFDVVSASDHPAGSAPTYEVWTMLAWIAASTRRIRVATRVLAVPLHPPAMVAKMAESLDRLSGGWLMLGRAVDRLGDRRPRYEIVDPVGVPGQEEGKPSCRWAWARRCSLC